MAEGFNRNHAQGALPNTGKNHIAQLLKANISRARDPIGHCQANRPKAKSPSRAWGIAPKRIHGGLIGKRPRNRDQFGNHQGGKGKDNPIFHPWHLFGPEIGPHLAQGDHARGATFRINRWPVCMWCGHYLETRIWSGDPNVKKRGADDQSPA